jgi:hypothetical protein
VATATPSLRPHAGASKLIRGVFPFDEVGGDGDCGGGVGDDLDDDIGDDDEGACTCSGDVVSTISSVYSSFWCSRKQD